MDNNDIKNIASDELTNDESPKDEFTNDEFANDESANSGFVNNEFASSEPIDDLSDVSTELVGGFGSTMEDSDIAPIMSFDEVSGDDLSKMAQEFGDRSFNQLSSEGNSSIDELEQQIRNEFKDSTLSTSTPSPTTDPLSTPTPSFTPSPTSISSPTTDPVSTTVLDSDKSQNEFWENPFDDTPPSFPTEFVDPVLRADSIETTDQSWSKDSSKPIDGVKSIESSIKEGFSASETEYQQDQSTQDFSKLGVGSTFYSDLNTAMSSNEPAIMSELLRKAEFEEKEKAILSPSSKKNLPYIIGAIALMLVSVLAWVFLFSKKEGEVSYITDQRVQSLVYSDQDLGINTTGLEVFQTKSAIRKLVERKNDRDTLSQIYYVIEDDQQLLRRIGVKDIFNATEAQVPTLLYDNIEHNFMHGVYTTDKNYPFLILKAISYDRAFEGMKEWEPTMIDDLSTYFDLPKEASDRSLMEDGFSDDLIKNKNVRVARYIPRSRDRGILDFFNFGNNNEETETSSTPDQTGVFDESIELTPESPSPFESASRGNIKEAIFAFLTKPFMTPFAFAQTGGGIGGTFLENTLGNSGAGRTVCYKATKKCINLLTGESLPGTSTASNSVYCYQDLLDPENPGTTYTPTQIVGHESEYICKQTLTGGDSINVGDSIGDTVTLYTKPICFDPVTGNRLSSSENVGTDSNALCFRPYQCRRVACFRSGQEVASSEEGKPGVSCKVTEEIVKPDSTVRKSCVQFNELLTLKNINNMNLCFDQYGRFVPVDNRIQTIGDFYVSDSVTQNQSVNQLIQSSAGLTCITPQMRYRRLCVTDSGMVVPGVVDDETEVQIGQIVSGSRVAFCFDQVPPNGVYEQFDNTNYDVRQKVAEAATMFRQTATYAGALSGVAGILGIDGVQEFLADFRNGLTATANLLMQISTVDLLHIPNPECLLDDVDSQISLGGGQSNNTGSVACLMEHAEANNLYLDHVQEVVYYIRQIEMMLNRMERYIPGSENRQAVVWARNSIEFVKKVLGMEHNITWITIGNKLPQGIDIHPGDVLSSGDGMLAVQESLVQLGLLDPLSATGELDLVTQQAISAFQGANGLPQSISVDQVFLSAETLQILGSIAQTADGLYGDDSIATIDDFFTEPSQLGSFNNEVQMLQVILYVNGYNISSLDGVFDSEVCSALQNYQADNNLELADATNCQLSEETIASLNGVITQNDYLGSGFAISTNGALEGTGSFLGMTGPGVISYDAINAEARGLQEGDTVLMYTFLDEETILITTNDSVITEIIRRRALDSIFNS